jgi:hypothetical protein
MWHSTWNWDGPINRKAKKHWQQIFKKKKQKSTWDNPSDLLPKPWDYDEPVKDKLEKTKKQDY